jgi:hypothetical protein
MLTRLAARDAVRYRLGDSLALRDFHFKPQVMQRERQMCEGVAHGLQVLHQFVFQVHA